MSDYEYIPMSAYNFRGLMFPVSKLKRKKPSLTVEVTRRYVTFIRPGTSTSYEPSRPSYDRLANLANSGAYVVNILPSSMGIAWSMRRKGVSGDDWGKTVDYLLAHAPDPEPDYEMPEPPEDYDDEDKPHYDTPGGW